MQCSVPVAQIPSNPVAQAAPDPGPRCRRVHRSRRPARCIPRWSAHTPPALRLHPHPHRAPRPAPRRLPRLRPTCLLFRRFHRCPRCRPCLPFLQRLPYRRSPPNPPLPRSAARTRRRLASSTTAREHKGHNRRTEESHTNTTHARLLSVADCRRTRPVDPAVKRGSMSEAAFTRPVSRPAEAGRAGPPRTPPDNRLSDALP